MTITAFDGRMLNVHPPSLPEFGGQGMYLGAFVFAACLLTLAVASWLWILR